MAISKKSAVGGTAVLAVTLVAAAAGASPALATNNQKAKNIILLIGDGMGVTHIDAARQVRYGAAGALVMETLGEQGSVSTYAVERNSDQPALVTDSASSATAWSSGVKTYNAAIGLDAFGKVVPTLMEQAAASGLRTGNVSTAEITDATPAAMMSHATLRGCQGPTYTVAACETLGGAAYLPIAQQIARNQTADVILGGGNARFTAEDEKIMEGNGYRTLGTFGSAGAPAVAASGTTPATPAVAATGVVATKTELAAVTGRDQRVIGLFNTGNLTPEVNKAKAFPTPAVQAEPTLRDMTNKAIELLANSKEGQDTGFLLQVEGAQIDKRSHANDAAQTIGETLAFDDAVEAARDFAKKDGNTLVIVTADHECAGFNIIAPGSFTNAEASAPPINQSGTSSTQTPVRASNTTLDPARSTGPVNGSGNTNARNFAPATFRTADDPAGVKDGDPAASLHLAYLSGNHTGADVNIYAYGPGAKPFDTKIDNTDMYDIMTSALAGLKK